MDPWKLPSNFWIAVEKGMLYYTENPVNTTDRPPPTTLFPPTFNNQRNTLKLAFEAQLAIGWENFGKGWELS
jgi:hypothetical protein